MRTRKEIYADILYHGLIDIQDHADNPRACYFQADHLLFLTYFFQNFDHDDDAHRFYWEKVRPAFIGWSEPERLGRFQQLWAELEEAIRREAGL